MNAKDELLHALARYKVKMVAAKITLDRYIDRQYSEEKYLLKRGYSEEQLEYFLECLNIEYDSGYSSQDLYGTVWLEDGTWLERADYDGSEWWEHMFLPEIPEELL